MSYCATTLPPKGGGKVVTQRHVEGEGDDRAFLLPAEVLLFQDRDRPVLRLPSA